MNIYDLKKFEQLRQMLKNDGYEINHELQTLNDMSYIIRGDPIAEYESLRISMSSLGPMKGHITAYADNLLKIIDKSDDCNSIYCLIKNYIVPPGFYIKG